MNLLSRWWIAACTWGAYVLYTVAARRAKELETWLDVRIHEDWALKKVEVR